MSTNWKPVAATFGVAAVLAVAAIGASSARQAQPAKPAAAAQVAVTSQATQAATEPAADAPAAVRVDPTTVCMVNDHAMGKAQIPVQVGDKTYYGCCEMCKTRLAQDEAVRFAVDPVTGERVDKATAVIGERPDGSVVYFASEENLARFAAGDSAG